MCDARGCIQQITAKGNTVIATYVLPTSTDKLLPDMVVNRAETAAKMRPNVVRDICGAIQRDFPDKSMRWVANHYTRDNVFLVTVLVEVSECF